MITGEKKKRFAELWLPILRTELDKGLGAPKPPPMRKHRFHLDHISNMYLVIDLPKRRVVASHPYTSESNRDLAYRRARQDTIKRNEAEAK
jgi:hypothetical protein